MASHSNSPPDSSSRFNEAVSLLIISGFSQYRVSLIVALSSRCLILGAFAILFITYFQTDVIAVTTIALSVSGYLSCEIGLFVLKTSRTRRFIERFFLEQLPDLKPVNAVQLHEELESLLADVDYTLKEVDVFREQFTKRYLGEKSSTKFDRKDDK